MDDSRIIQNILDGDIDAFTLLINKYRKKLFSMVGKRVPYQDCDIVVQDAFIRAFRGLSGFDLSRPFENWLTIIAMRACCDYWRKENRFLAVSDQNIQNQSEHDIWMEKVETAKSVEEFERSVSKTETREIIEIVFKRLNAEDRMLVELIYFEEWKLKDVAEAMQWKLSKVKVRAMRARKKMRAIISEIIDEKER